MNDSTKIVSIINFFFKTVAIAGVKKERKGVNKYSKGEKEISN